MNVAWMQRPTGCLKAVMRRNRLVRTISRTMTTAEPLTLRSPNYSPRQTARAAKVGKFHIWPEVTSLRSTHPDPMPAFQAQQISKADPTGARTRLFSKKHADSAKVGDVLMVTTKQGEPFAGAFIQIRRRGLDTSILLRGQMMRTGTEMWFKIYSPTVTGIDIIWRRPKRARRARLTYMRQPKHDMGSVDNLVVAWRRERHALRSKSAGSGKSYGKQIGAKAK